MNKEEFLKQLQEALRGKVGPEVIRDNLNFYETYILQEMRKEKTEREVLQELGNPRILAQTIIDTSKMDTQAYKETRTEDEKERRHEDFGYGRTVTGNRARFLLWGIVAVVILVVLGILLLVGQIFALVAPFLIPILLLIIVVRMIGRRR